MTTTTASNAKVKMFCYGRFILVDEDQVLKHVKKAELIEKASSLQHLLTTTKHIPTLAWVNKELDATIKKLNRLKRTIRQNVQTCA
jgi:hypothetical protein